MRTRPLHIDGLHTTITDVEVREQAAEFTLHVEVIDSDAVETAPAD